ncbi:AAA family ATPase [Pseudoalteromonas sp. T1lg88]|uniref:AAA family ATPase n=1 Tax=Pseudoalteromonas sp. T1lg88 TaxID=2077104 RepID=UPI000CF69124|nr:AAA family ATPase [Pseudoalteromonas sp. T1lg88]
MKLQNLELVGEFKSIAGTRNRPFIYEFTDSKKAFNPLCLVGLNGSGKSNFIELLADIFNYADRFFNQQFSSKNELNYNFSLSYQIEFEGVEVDVDLVCTDGHLVLDYDEKLVTIYNPHDLLPKHVIAYSSGHNQGLSSIFAKNQFQYFDLIRQQGAFFREYTEKRNIAYEKAAIDSNAENDSMWRELSHYVRRKFETSADLFIWPESDRSNLDYYFQRPEDAPEAANISLPVGIFTDHSLNSLIFVFLMVCEGINKEKSEKFREFVKSEANIYGVSYFDIDIRLSEYRHFDKVIDIVGRLVKLSLASQKKSSPKELKGFNTETLSGRLSFRVNDEFLQSLRANYLDENYFFEHLITLNHLVAKRWSHDEKRTLKLDKYERNVPNLSGGLMPIRFTNIEIIYGENEIKSTYDRVSDGEHQLIQVVGSLLLFSSEQTLFILDEPESHFNPEWRTEFLDLIEKYVDTSKMELLISTHSPFLLSACKSNRVLSFKKNDKSEVEITDLDIQTYGAGFDSLLTSVFEMEVLISQKPLNEIREKLRKYDDGEVDAVTALESLKEYGDSFELNYRVNQLKQELKKQGQRES